MRLLAALCAVTFALFASEEAAAGPYDGRYAGAAQVSPGSSCIAGAYGVDLTVTGSRFSATVTRIGGGRDGTTFRMAGSVDADGSFEATELGGVRATGFSGRIDGPAPNNVLSGTGGGTSCFWNFELPYVLRRAGAPERETSASYVSDEARSRLDALRHRFDRIEAMKSAPELFRVDVRYETDPFEICIKDGVATLKADPTALERAFGFAARTLESAALGVSFSAKAGELTSASVRSAVVAAGRNAAAASGRRMTLRQIKALARRGEVASRVASAALSPAMKKLDPIGFSRSQIEKRVPEAFFNGGPLKTTVADGLEIYAALHTAAAVVRANSEAVYCRLIETQRSLARDVASAARALDVPADGACRAPAHETYEELRRMQAKLLHDISGIGEGRLRDFGTNWTLDAQYRDLGCVLAAKQNVPPRLRPR